MPSQKDSSPSSSEKIGWLFHEIQQSGSTADPKYWSHWKYLAKEYQANLQYPAEEGSPDCIMNAYLTMIIEGEGAPKTDIEDSVVGDMLELFPQVTGTVRPSISRKDIATVSMVADKARGLLSVERFTNLSIHELEELFNTMRAASRGLDAVVLNMRKMQPRPSRAKFTEASNASDMTVPCLPGEEPALGTKRPKTSPGEGDRKKVNPSSAKSNYRLSSSQESQDQYAAAARSNLMLPNPEQQTNLGAHGDHSQYGGLQFGPNQPPSYTEYWSQNGSGGFLNTPPAGIPAATTFNSNVEPPQTFIAEPPVTWPSLYDPSKRNQQPQSSRPQPPASSMPTSSAYQGGFNGYYGSFDDDGRHSSQF